MVRPTGSQTRTFNYTDSPGNTGNVQAYLQDATNENGKVSYTYTWFGKVSTKTDNNHNVTINDNKGDVTWYEYDDYQRLIKIHYYTHSGYCDVNEVNCVPPLVEDLAAQVVMTYDSNTEQNVGGNYSQGLLGRLATRKWTGNNVTFTDMFGYSAAGQVTAKKLRVSRSFASSGQTASADLDASWVYNQEGKLTTMTYPGGSPSYSYGYNAMGQLNTMTDPTYPYGGQTIIDSATYGPAGELLTMAGETREYNSRLQLTKLNGVVYSYPAANNGKIQSQTNPTSGEQITYQYDELNRLIKAETADNPAVPQWGQGFSYDGFGNLIEKRVTKGSAPQMSLGALRAYYFDSKGNQTSTADQTILTYDYENRMVRSTNNGALTGNYYGYDPGNRRVYTADWMGNPEVVSNEAVYFYGADGRMMGAYRLTANAGSTLTLSVVGGRAYFGGKELNGEDRLGSVGTYYPYGETRGTPSSGRFATYSRDASGLDYAVNRYYSSTLGRFMTPDPYRANIGGPADPGSWNRYAYVQG